LRKGIRQDHAWRKTQQQMFRFYQGQWRFSMLLQSFVVALIE
jgi:hypothetical protein